MELHVLPLLSLPSVVHDALAIAGIAAALIAFLAFISLGVLLPGVLTTLRGSVPDRRDAYPEFGPAAYPVISEPAPRRGAMSESPQDRAGQHIARSHLWRLLSGSPVSLMAPPARSIGR
jgi:hypothetical protein